MAFAGVQPDPYTESNPTPVAQRSLESNPTPVAVVQPESNPTPVVLSWTPVVVLSW